MVDDRWPRFISLCAPCVRSDGYSKYTCAALLVVLRADRHRKPVPLPAVRRERWSFSYIRGPNTSAPSCHHDPRDLDGVGMSCRGEGERRPRMGPATALQRRLTLRPDDMASIEGRSACSTWRSRNYATDAAVFNGEELPSVPLQCPSIFAPSSLALLASYRQSVLLGSLHSRAADQE